MERYTQPLQEKVEAGEIDPSFVITHNRPIKEGPELYKTFPDKKDVHQSGVEAVVRKRVCPVRIGLRQLGQASARRI